MTRFLFVISILSNNLIAQDTTHLINPYNFEEGGYSLVSLKVRYNRVDTNNHYYTNNPIEIKQIQQNLIGVAEPIVYPFGCFEDQLLILCKDALVLETVSFSSNCKAVSSKNGEFHHVGSGPVLSNILHQKKHQFSSREAGFLFIDSIRQDSNLVLIHPENWMDYEGQFGFFYESNDYDTKKAQTFLQNQLSKQFPSEKFSLQSSSYGGSKEQKYRFHGIVYSNKSLYDKFNLYPIDNNKWKNFEVQFDSYWR